MNPRILLLVLCGGTLASCASIYSPEPGSPLYEQSVKETQQAMLETIEKQTILRALTYPILSANSDLCENHRITKLEFEWITLNDLRVVGPIQRAAGAALGIGTFPSVTVVTPGSPVHQAGLRTGDTLVSINDVAINEDKEGRVTAWIQKGKDKVRRYRESFNKTLHREARGDSSVSIRYRRNEHTYTIEVQPVARSDFKIALLDHDELISRAVDNTIFLSTALFEFAETDAEIQFIFAHEIAHRIYKHRPGKLTALRALALGADALLNYAVIATQLVNALISGDEADETILVPGAVFSQQNNPPYRHTFELEADYLAMYMLARASIDFSDIDIFWKRIPSDSQLSQIHVTEEGRIENMIDIQDELSRKIDAGSTLTPSETRNLQSDSEGSQEN